MFLFSAFTACLWFALFLVPARTASLGTQDGALRRSEGPYIGVATAETLGYWPFVRTLDDVSSNHRGPALINGTNVALKTPGIDLGFVLGTSGYVEIREPGFLSIPTVDIRTIDFAIDFNLRLPSAPTSRQILLSNWQPNEWQYLMTIEDSGELTFVLRRNIVTNGSNPAQDLVTVTTADKVPIGSFFNVVHVYNTNRRTLSVYINGLLSATGSVPSDITDLTLHESTQSYVQFGCKADDEPVSGQLNADLSHLRFLRLNFLTLGLPM